MNVVLLPILFLAAYIICCTTAFQSPQQSLIHRRSSELRSDDSSDDRFDVFQDKLDETVLRINFSYDDDDKGNLALSAIQNYTRSFPFVAVLPVQPLTYLPVRIPDKQKDGDRGLVVPTSCNTGLKVTFLRKKTQEKGSQDGGMLFSSSLVSEEDCDGDGSLENYKKTIQLTAWRITDGQTVSKVFSEKQLIMGFIKGLHEGKGKELLGAHGIDVESIFHVWMDGGSNGPIIQFD